MTGLRSAIREIDREKARRIKATTGNE